MDIQLVQENVHKRGLFSFKAFKLIFTDKGIYFLHLGKDAKAMPLGKMAGGLAGAISQSVAEKISEKGMDKRLQQIEKEGLDSYLAKDKRSFRAAYRDIENFETGPYKWNRWPHITFTITGKGKHKFIFNLQNTNIESEREAVAGFMRKKRPDLFR